MPSTTIEKKTAKLRIEDVAYCAVVTWTCGAVAFVTFYLAVSLMRLV